MRTAASPLETTTIYRCFAILGFMLLAAGCVNNNQKRPVTKQETVVPGGNDGPSDLPSEGPDSDDFVDGGSDEEPVDDPLAALLADCGATDLTGRDPNDVIYASQIKTVEKGFVASLITARIEVDVAVTAQRTTQDARVFIDAGGGLIDALLDNFEEAQTGKTIADNVPFADYSSLSNYETWSGVLCTFVPAKQIVNERGGRTVVRFDPPIPAALSPKAVAERYAIEIGERREFVGIKATIVETDNPDLAGYEEIAGSVTVEKVSPQSSIENAAGETVEISADLAYRLTYNFESPDVVTAMGLNPAMTYYVSHEKRDLVANTLHSQKVLLGDFTFVHNE